VSKSTLPKHLEASADASTGASMERKYSQRGVFEKSFTLPLT
jgi:hypothetical protein